MIEQWLRNDLKTAMKAKDPARVTVLRTALAAIANAEATPASDGPAWLQRPAGSTEVDRLELTEDDRRQVIAEQIAEREDNVAVYERNGREAEAAVVRAEIAILRDYLR